MAKTFFGKILAAIGSIFAGLFNAGKKTYEKLPKEMQDALLWGSGFIDLINEMIGEAPEKIREALQAKFPGLDIPKLEAGLFEIASALGLLPTGKDINYLISVLQEYLKSKEGKYWADASRSLSTLVALIFAPAGTKLEAVASIIGVVYHWLVKKK